VAQLCFNMGARSHNTCSDEAFSFGALETTVSTLHVFHVDDSVDDHLLLKAAAEMAQVSFTWDVAESADTAIFYLRTLLALNGKGSLRWPDLVLLDVLLPQGGGFKVLEFIRAEPKLSSLRVVVLSGSNAPGILEQAYALGANSVLLKPGAFRDLVKLAASLHATWSTPRRLSPEVSPVADVIHLTAR
jgi:CheY-like chemotaxis protein